MLNALKGVVRGHTTRVAEALGFSPGNALVVELELLEFRTVVLLAELWYRLRRYQRRRP